MILLSAAVFIVGALVSAASQEIVMLVLARFVVGAAVGVASAVAPVYISEVAPPEVRGRLVTFFQLAVTVGILVASLVALAFDASEGWRWMLGLGAVPAIVLGVGMLRMPQSPRWLVMAGEDYEARAVLERIRSGDPDTIEQEIVEIRKDLKAEPGTYKDLLKPVVKAALIVGVGLAILQQVSGINTVIYYAPTIIQFTGVESTGAAILASVGVGVVNVAMTIVAIAAAGPRRPPAAAPDRHGADGNGAGDPRDRLRHRRREHCRLDRRSRGPDDLRRRLRDQPRADLLASERRALPAPGSQQGGRDRDDGELDLQRHRRVHVPAADRPSRDAAARSGYTPVSACSPSSSAGSSCPRQRGSRSRRSRRSSASAPG